MTLAQAPARPVPSMAMRWYVLIVMSVVYAISMIVAPPPRDPNAVH